MFWFLGELLKYKIASFWGWLNKNHQPLNLEGRSRDSFLTHNNKNITRRTATMKINLTF
jgi:hypothetical protein